MGGRFPMAGQTTSSWPSAKTLQSTKHDIPNKLGPSLGSGSQVFTFSQRFEIMTSAAQNSKEHYLSQFLLWFEFKLQVETQALLVFIWRKSEVKSFSLHLNTSPLTVFWGLPSYYVPSASICCRVFCCSYTAG